MIAFDEPGTTRDSIYIEFERNGRPYTVIDTAGVRRRGRIGEAVEKFSVVKTLQTIEDANVVILVLDATKEIADQDANIASFIVEAGRALVVAINKWDAADAHGRERIKREYERKLGFLGFARVHMISAGGAERAWRADALGRCCVDGSNVTAADAETDAHIAGRDRKTGAAASRLPAAEAALCAPGRCQSTPHYRARQFPAGCIRGLPALPGAGFSCRHSGCVARRSG